MGFSINSNGKIVNNSYYQKYLNISKQYMMGPYKDNASEPNNYIFDSSNTKFDAKYIKEKLNGDSEWNTMSNKDRV